MMIWCEANPVVRSLILSAVFVTLCLSLCLIPAVFRRKGVGSKILVCLCALLCFSCVVLFGTGMKAAYYGTAQGPVSRWFEELSLWIPVGILVTVAAYLILLLHNNAVLRRNTITSGAIKESLDHLHTGLCFCDENGMVILANHQMYNLCQQIVGRDLQNAVLFWELVSKGTVSDQVQRLCEGEQPAFRLQDRTVWCFRRTAGDGVIQIIAADITQLQELVDDLAETNLALAERNLRLRAYGENVENLARMQEHLDTKARIHGQFGRALLATRHHLFSEEENHGQILTMWGETADTLRKVTVIRPDETSLQALQNAAQAAGLTLELRGNVPPRSKTAQLFLQAAMEALTNAVRHANAQCLYFEISETADMDIARFANDGNIPKATVVEGGGLGALRRKIELAGGTMTIETTPAFALVLIIPKERDDVL